MISRKKMIRSLMVLAVLSALGLVNPNGASAHCDGMDGPVVKAAQRALAAGDVNLVLIWVQQGDEAEIRKAFQETLAVRKLSPEAKTLADLYFFETLVRVHRAGEGAPYTGLKPAGRDLGPAIPAADKAIEEDAAAVLLRLLTDTLQDGIQEHFKHVIAAKNFKPDDLAAGREYVRAYVEFIHYVERIHEAVKAPAPGHYHESGDIRVPNE